MDINDIHEMLNKRPTYDNLYQALCFQCEGPLAGVTLTENRHGRGALRGYCSKCEKFTWFDVTKGDTQ